MRSEYQVTIIKQMHEALCLYQQYTFNICRIPVELMTFLVTRTKHPAEQLREIIYLAHGSERPIHSPCFSCSLDSASIVRQWNVRKRLFTSWQTGAERGSNWEEIWQAGAREGSNDLLPLTTPCLPQFHQLSIFQPIQILNPSMD